MPLASPRADNLGFFRDILILIHRKEITDQASFDRYLTENKGWKKSRRYHYLSGLRDSHFIVKEKGNIKLEEAGLRTVEVGINSFGGLDWTKSQLGEEEKEVIKKHLLQYDPFVNFLSLFVEKGRLIHSYRTFYKEAQAIGFEFYKEECDQEIIGQNDRHIILSGWRVVRPTGSSKSLSKSEKPAIMWTLKYWGKSLDLIDELWIPQFRKYSGRFQKAVFPIKMQDNEITLVKFRNLLDTLIDERDYVSSYIPIPILIHDFCTTYFVKVKTFLTFLCLLHFELPGEYYLDKVSRAYIDERFHSIGKRKKPEGGYQRNYTNYPRIDNFFSSHLVVRKNRR